MLWQRPSASNTHGFGSTHATVDQVVPVAVIQEIESKGLYLAPLPYTFDIVWLESNCQGAYNFDRGMGIVWFQQQDDYLNYVMTWY